MLKKIFFFMLITVFAFLACIPLAGAGQRLEPLGKGITIWFDTGGPAGGPCNTIVQNGALQAASDLGCDLKLLYSDWNPENMIANFKTALAARPNAYRPHRFPDLFSIRQVRFRPCLAASGFSTEFLRRS